MPSAPVVLPQADDPSLETWLALARAFQKIQRRLERVLDAAGLTLAQFDVLANLGLSEGLTQQELARRLLVTKGNVCGLLDRMESADLVERRADPHDRRANRIFLTQNGRGALKAAFPVHLGLIQKCLAPLSAAETCALVTLLDRIDAADLS